MSFELILGIEVSFGVQAMDSDAVSQHQQRVMALFRE